MNRLANERSAYLQHASHQKIDWYPWGDEAFEKARSENKPVFLSSGAVWCHWCHVMAKESFEDDQVAAILNELYVPVKLDRDERPDIDRRYQRAVAAMGQGGGWPLSVFLTPDREPFYGGTYFPPFEGYGRPAFKTLLLALAQAFREKRGEIDKAGRSLLDAINVRRPGKGAVSEDLLAEAAKGLLAEADERRGGFGSAPKFPMSGAIEFLLGRYALTGDEQIGAVLRKTLTAMAEGGFHDHLGGGFHRYSTDAQWTIPHFEKMADDNAWLLRNYAAAYRVLGDTAFRRVAEGIIGFVRRELSDPEGGFYASQDADVTPDDEGGYFTWTVDEIREVLAADEWEAFSPSFLHENGSMHHEPAKRVLFLASPLEEVARKADLPVDRVKALIAAAQGKLLRRREERQRPFIDRAMYTSLNGMMISAFLRAYRAFGGDDVRDFALKSLERVLSGNVMNGGLYHAPGVAALLDDFSYLVDALISAYEVTGNGGYLEKAEAFMDRCLKDFSDTSSGGFFDTAGDVLGMRLKGVEDVPHPSANAVAAMNLLRLSSITGKPAYREEAEKALGSFAGDAALMSIHAGCYFSALDAFFNGAEIALWAAPGSELTRQALDVYYPYATIAYREDRGYLVPCLRSVCYEPLTDVAALREILQTKRQA